MEYYIFTDVVRLVPFGIALGVFVHFVGWSISFVVVKIKHIISIAV